MVSKEDVSATQAQVWIDLLEASNIPIGDTAVFILEGGSPRIVKGTLIGVAEVGTGGITYLRVAVSQSLEQLPVGGVLTILTDKIVAFGKAAAGGGD